MVDNQPCVSEWLYLFHRWYLARLPPWCAVGSVELRSAAVHVQGGHRNMSFWPRLALKIIGAKVGSVQKGGYSVQWFVDSLDSIGIHGIHGSMESMESTNHCTE